MTNRRFEMYLYRQILVRMRQGDSDREIARSVLSSLLKKITFWHKGMIMNMRITITEIVERQRQVRHALETRLIKIWENVFDKQPIGVDDNFWALGGDLLLSERLCAHIEEDLCITLPLDVFALAPTVAQLANILIKEGWSTPRPSLVSLQPSGSKPPFFCVHDGYGEVHCYRKLAHLLGTDQPVYGLQFPVLDASNVKYTTIEDMATHYIREMQTIQPEGPYFIGGHCVGAIVAFDMAQQLRANGCNVGLLAMLDTGGPPNTKRSVEYYFRYGMRAFRSSPAGAVNYVCQLVVKGILKQTRKVIRRKISRSHSFDIQHLYIAHTEVILSNAYNSYVPQVYPGRITFFQNSERARLAYNRWSEFAVDGLAQHIYPGTPESTFQYPSIQIIADKLSHSLAVVQAGLFNA